MQDAPFLRSLLCQATGLSERFIAAIALASSLAGVASATSIPGDPSSPHPEYSVPMIEMRDSNERGAVLLRNQAKSTLVVVKVDKPQEGQPVEIATGTCERAQLKYHLTPLASGQTITSLPSVSVSTLRNANYLVVIRRSATDHRVVSCGTLSAQN